MFDAAPDEWGTRTLGSLIDFVNGYPFKPEDWSPSGKPIIRIQNLNGSREFNYYDGNIPARFHVRDGDLLFCWSGSRGTSFGPRKWNGPLGYLNQHIFRCVASEDIDPDFAFFLLGGMTKRIEAEAHGGGGLVHIKKSELVQFEALIPPLDEQRRIAKVLRSVDDALEVAAEVSRQAEVARDKLVATSFESDGDMVPLETACSLIYRYPGFYGFEQKQQGVPVIRGEHLRNGRISTDWNDFYYVDPDFSARFPKTILRKDDVVMSVRGTVGTAAVVEGAHVGSQISPNLIRLVANAERLLPPLLYYVVQSVVAHMRATIVNAQALPAINAGDIKKVKVALPPLEQQRDLLSRLLAAGQACSETRGALNQLLLVRAEVAADLLSGRVRVPT